jgi:hypothetical protein
MIETPRIIMECHISSRDQGQTKQETLTFSSQQSAVFTELRRMMCEKQLKPHEIKLVKGKLMVPLDSYQHLKAALDFALTALSL